MNNFHMPRYFLTTLFFIFTLLIQPLAHAEEEKAEKKISPSELQSQLMGFADRFMGVVTGTTLEYILDTPTITPLQRALVQARKLEATAAAVRIAAGVNPEVSLLDMIVLVSLLRFSTEVHIILNVLGANARVLLTGYQKLERDIWEIADEVLSEEQEAELHDLIEEWQDANPKTVGVVFLRFSAFAGDRGLSTLVDAGEPGWFLANISQASKELEHTRVLAERTLYIAERQITLLRWQVEQVFFDLATTPEFKGLLNSSIDISQASQRMAALLETMPKMVSAESEVIIKVFMRELENERREMITQMFKEIAAERQATIDQASEQFVNKAFYVGSLLIIIFMVTALIAMLIYKYFSQRMSR